MAVIAMLVRTHAVILQAFDGIVEISSACAYPRGLELFLIRVSKRGVCDSPRCTLESTDRSHGRASEDTATSAAISLSFSKISFYVPDTCLAISHLMNLLG